MIKEVGTGYLSRKAVELERDFLTNYGFSYTRKTIYHFLKNCIVEMDSEQNAILIDYDKIKSVYNELKKLVESMYFDYITGETDSPGIELDQSLWISSHDVYDKRYV